MTAVESRPAEPVLHIVPALFGDDGVVGGAERYVFELARHMASYRPTSLLAFGKTPAEHRAGDLRVRIAGCRYVRGQKSNPVSAAIVSEVMRARVVHCHQQHIVASSLAALVSRVTGRKVFVSDLGGGGWDISGYISTDRWYHGHLHMSQYSRDVFGHAGKRWAHVIYGGIDTERFSPNGAPAPGAPVLYAGRILPHKGIDQLISALPPGMRLEIVGRPYHPEYMRDLQKLAAGKDVAFLTGCSDEELVAAYRRSLCVVLPSVYTDCYGGYSAVPELLGQTLLEGMACGRPAICTEVASMPEVVVDGRTGFVVPPRNPGFLAGRIRWLRDNPMAAAEMGRAARARVLERFTWPGVVRRCLEIYSSLR